MIWVVGYSSASADCGLCNKAFAVWLFRSRWDLQNGYDVVMLVLEVRMKPQFEIAAASVLCARLRRAVS